MTRSLKKQRERFFAEDAARLLGKAWNLSEDRERPDFVVTECGARFGLEVTEIFKGPQGSKGSALKANESSTHRIVASLQREYESTSDVPLTVKFVGSMESSNLATVVAALVAQDLQSKSNGYRFICDTTALLPHQAPLCVHVTKGRRNWFSVNDRVGFVDRYPHAIIAAAIEYKAKELANYKAACGNDVRLLFLADHINNSGKLSLEDATSFAFHGFEAVYLFLYPENVIVLSESIE